MDREGNQNLEDYIKKNIAKGYNEDSLKWALLNQGYSRSAVERAFLHVNREKEQRRAENQRAKEKPKIKYEIYGADNKPIRIRKPFFTKIKDFFKNI